MGGGQPINIGKLYLNFERFSDQSGALARESVNQANAFNFNNISQRDGEGRNHKQDIGSQPKAAF